MVPNEELHMFISRKGQTLYKGQDVPRCPLYGGSIVDITSHIPPLLFIYTPLRIDVTIQ